MEQLKDYLKKKVKLLNQYDRVVSNRIVPVDDITENSIKIKKKHSSRNILLLAYAVK